MADRSPKSAAKNTKQRASQQVAKLARKAAEDTAKADRKAATSSARKPKG